MMRTGTQDHRPGRVRRGWRAPVVVTGLFTGLVPAACGGDDDEPAGPPPTTTSTTAATTTTVPERYTVQPGDTLSGIAQRFGTTVEAIVEANGIADPDVIEVGQELVIPPGDPGAPPG